MILDYEGVSEQGPVRDNNEDFVAWHRPDDAAMLQRRGWLGVIADGVSGHRAGEVASRVAAQTLVEAYYSGARKPLPALRHAFVQANLRVCDLGLTHPEYRRMETTLTALALVGHQAVLGHIGDTRVYRVRDGQAEQLTHDHSEVGELVRMQILTPEEAQRHPRRHIVTRTVGSELMTQADLRVEELQAGDCFILCTDGLWEPLAPHDLANAVADGTARDVARRLVDLALQRETRDNLSVQVVRVVDVETPSVDTGINFFRHSLEPIEQPMTYRPGDRKDQFTILEKLGHGGMSEVYRARREGETADVVLKFPHEDTAGDPAAFERLRREIQIGQLLTHAHIQKVCGLQGDATDPYLVMEFVDGATLRDQLRRDRSMSVERTVALGCQLAEALSYAHQNQVFHRDLKPENIIIAPSGDAKVMDFGIAWVEGARRITWGKLSGEVGTPDYMAPEQIKGQRGDARTDVYALGMILYECLAGRLPYQGDNALSIMNQHVTVSAPPLQRFAPTVSVEVAEVVMKCIRRPPEARWDSMDALLGALAHPDPVLAAELQVERERGEQSEGDGPQYEFGVAPWKAAALVGAILAGLAVMVVVIQYFHGR